MPGERGRLLQFSPGAILGERYRIVSLVGGGGMGEVYRADDLKLGQTVALKFIKGHGDSARLHEEVRIGRTVSHPNVCRLYDIAEVDGHLFITMEFVDGEDLASLLRRIGRLPVEKALALTREICAGLAAAHDKGVIHRDLKPANVMIDGRGRARVTDFGLALAAGSANDTAGTPMYMAPEQLVGERASIKSDIYALGLVLYEIFTGQRPFEGTIEHVLLARQHGEFTPPGGVTRDVPAVIERIIVRCLDADPEARPDSVEAIVLELPGGDPLAAAIAAGETPSPAMVAAASERGELSAAAGWSLLVLQIAGFLLFALLTARTTLYGRFPLKSPEVLHERVSEVLAATGQTLNRADASDVFATDLQQAYWIVGHGAPLEGMSPILFLHRQSPRPMVATNYEHRVLPNDPPFIFSGMADVALDSSGHLVQLTIFPQQLESPPAVPRKVDWNPLLNFTGLRGPMTPATPRWAAPVDSDQKAAWTLGADIRIEAASYHGRTVWFSVIPPWRQPVRMIELQADLGSRISTAVVVVTTFAFWAAAIALALRNLRRGQGDRRGAKRLAWSVLVTLLTGFLLMAHHIADAYDEMVMLMSSGGVALLLTAQAWIGYVAIEPLVRRRWPRMLIAAIRLLNGRVRDPMVGRDVLIGGTVGIIVILVRQCLALLPGVPPLQFASLALSGLRYVGWLASAELTLSIAGPIFFSTLLLGLHVVTRSLRASMLVAGALIALIVLGDLPGPLWVRTLFGVIVGAAVMTLLFRFGLLASGAATFVYLFLRRVPITLDPSAWYFGRSTFALALLIGVAIYAFIVYLGGKRWLPDVAVEG